MNGEKKTSPWVYVGIGCLIIAILGVIGVGGILFVGYRWAKGVKTSFEDPAVRSEKVMEILGCKELPKGYHAVLGLSVPFLMDVAILSDRESSKKGAFPGFRERGFLYVNALREGREQKELRSYIEDKDPNATPPGRRKTRIEAGQITFDAGEIIHKGIIDAQSPKLLYTVQRGSLTVKGSHFEGLAAIILIDCGTDERMREAIWFAPDPSAPKTAGAPSAEDRQGEGTPPSEPSTSPGETATEEASVIAGPSGTAADEPAIRDFLSRFSLCH